MIEIKVEMNGKIKSRGLFHGTVECKDLHIGSDSITMTKEQIVELKSTLAKIIDRINNEESI